MALPDSVFDDSDVKQTQTSGLPDSVFDDSDLNPKTASNAINYNNAYNVSDDDVTPVTPYNATRNTILSNLSNVPGDVLAGTAELGHGLINAPHNIVVNASQITGIPQLLSSLGIASQSDINKFANKILPNQPDYNFSAIAGVPNPGLGDKFIQGLTQYSPYALGGEVALAENPSFLTRLLNAGGTGGVFGATQSPTPIKSGLASAALNVGGQTLGDLVGGTYNFLTGNKNTVNAAGNRILDYLTKQVAKKQALSPEDAALNLQNNFTDVNGAPVNTDIGTVANNPFLKTVNSAAGEVPFSGVSERQNVVNDALLTKKISDAQNDVQTAQYNPEAEYLQNKIQSLQQNPHADALQSQIESLKQNPTAENLQSQIADVEAQRQQHDDAINAAPQFINSLADGVPANQSVPQFAADNVRGAYKNNKEEATALYEPLNDPSVRLDTLAAPGDFNAYAKPAADLVAQRENLTNLYGSSSDLGAKLNAEIDKAQSFMENKDTAGVTLPEAMTRIQNLGQLAADTYASGNKYASKLLGNLRDGLSSSVDTVLRNSGNSDKADQLNAANSFYKNSVVPFWKDPEINKVINNKNYIPQQGKIGNALHNTNNASILNQLPQEAKNAALHNLITGGGGTSSGATNVTPAQLGATYASKGMTVDKKRLIASYNPGADEYLEALPGMISNRDNLAANSTELNRQLQQSIKGNQVQTNNLTKQLQRSQAGNAAQQNALQKQLQTSVNNQAKQQRDAQANLDKLIQQKYGNTPKQSPQSDLLAKALKTLALGVTGAHYLGKGALGATGVAPLAARTVNKIVSNPDLIQAYIKGQKLPVKSSSNLARYINPILQGLFK